MARALEQAKAGRLHILELMKEALPAPATKLPASVPRLVCARGSTRVLALGLPACKCSPRRREDRPECSPSGSLHASAHHGAARACAQVRAKIDPSKVGMVIGPKGATIKEIIETSGVDNIVVDGDAAVVTVSGFDDDKIQAALDRIEAIAGLGGGTTGRPAKPRPPPPPPINEGDKYDGVVRSIVPFGIFVQLVEGVDGFCHISELSSDFVRAQWARRPTDGH
jgi:polyribonucleotide nucleotidyltransferase